MLQQQGCYASIVWLRLPPALLAWQWAVLACRISGSVSGTLCFILCRQPVVSADLLMIVHSMPRRRHKLH
jgi:hypothetical protein